MAVSTSPLALWKVLEGAYVASSGRTTAPLLKHRGAVALSSLSGEGTDLALTSEESK